MLFSSLIVDAAGKTELQIKSEELFNLTEEVLFNLTEEVVGYQNQLFEIHLENDGELTTAKKADFISLLESIHHQTYNVLRPKLSNLIKSALTKSALTKSAYNDNFRNLAYKFKNLFSAVNHLALISLDQEYLIII